jgi:hypothetical protein
MYAMVEWESPFHKEKTQPAIDQGQQLNQGEKTKPRVNQRARSPETSEELAEMKNKRRGNPNPRSSGRVTT